MSVGATSELAAFVARTSYDGLPHDVRETLHGLLIDYFRVASVGRHARWADKYRAGLSTTMGKPQASLLYARERADVVRAAGVNGVIAGSLEWDDTHVGAMLHPGVAVWPAALAIGETTGATGAEILAAVAAGYETIIRVGLSVQPAHFQRGFQSTSTCGVFGAAAAAAKLLGLDETGIRNALGIATSYAGGVTQFFLSGSEVKRIHAGKAAAAGVEAALFAAAGLSGPPDAIEGRQGFANALAGAFDASAISYGLGDDWRLLRLQMKPHAVSARVLAAAEAAEILVRQGLRAEDVERAVIGVPSVIVGRLTNNDPRDIQQAQMSSPFAVAMALMCTPSSGEPLVIGFDTCEAALAREDVRALSRKIVCEIDPEIETLSTKEYVAARLRVVTRDGRTHEALVPVPIGSPERPMRADDLLARFKTMSRGVIALAALDNWMSRIGDIAAPGWAGVVMSLQAGEGRS
jgi:2-methylcitrate dehydratase PrpD